MKLPSSQRTASRVYSSAESIALNMRFGGNSDDGMDLDFDGPDDVDGNADDLDDLLQFPSLL